MSSIQTPESVTELSVSSIKSICIVCPEYKNQDDKYITCFQAHNNAFIGVFSNYMNWSQIIDINESEMPSDFNTYCFDITQEWPKLNPFDYIIFPESFTCLNPFSGNRPDRRKAASSLFINALNVLEKNGEIRGDGHNFFKEDFEMRNCCLPWVEFSVRMIVLSD